jgi:hypothetical protein
MYVAVFAGTGKASASGYALFAVFVPVITCIPIYSRRRH